MFAPYQQKRHERWRADYRADRYLAGASIAALEERSRDLGHNMFWLNAKGQLTVRSSTERDLQWWILWTHFLEELRLRGETWQRPNLFDQSWVESIICAPEVPRGLSLLRGAKLPDSPHLVRLGRTEHLREAYRLGRFRIAPASSYSDPSLNAAIGDDERTLITISLPKILPSDRSAADHAKLGAEPIGEIVRTAKMAGDFYVLCLSNSYDPRLVVDFGADAVLVIRKPATFARRLHRSVARERPDLRPWFGAVEYYDPYQPGLDPTHIPMLKHFRFAYQDEMRFAWTAVTAQETWPPFFVEVGPLREIADLYLP